MIKDNLSKKREYNNKYQKKWRNNNKNKWKEIQKKSNSRIERKEYLKNWWKGDKAKTIRKRFNDSKKRKDYIINWNKNNKDKLRNKYKRYYNTIKGIVNYLKKKDRKKFGLVNNELTEDLIKYINERDKFCIYCSDELNGKTEYDHVNPFKLFDKNNIVRCCKKCNRSKSSADVLEWCKFKNYKVSEKLMNLYKQSR